MSKIFVLLMISFIAACSAEPSKSTAIDAKIISHTDTPAYQAPQPADNDSTMYVHFQKDSVAATVTGWLKKGRPVKVFADVKHGTLMIVVLKPVNPPINVRINQLITPNGKADGPYGSKLTHKITERGRYCIVVGTNLMADGPDHGKFELELFIK